MIWPNYTPKSFLVLEKSEKTLMFIVIEGMLNRLEIVLRKTPDPKRFEIFKVQILPKV